MKDNKKVRKPINQQAIDKATSLHKSMLNDKNSNDNSMSEDINFSSNDTDNSMLDGVNFSSNDTDNSMLDDINFSSNDTSMLEDINFSPNGNSMLDDININYSPNDNSMLDDINFSSDDNSNSMLEDINFSSNDNYMLDGVDFSSNDNDSSMLDDINFSSDDNSNSMLDGVNFSSDDNSMLDGVDFSSNDNSNYMLDDSTSNSNSNNTQQLLNGRNKVERRKPKKFKPFFYVFILIFIISAGFVVKDILTGDNNENSSENPITPNSPLLIGKKDKELYTDVKNKDGTVVSSNEENWDNKRVERDGEHRTKLSDKQIGKISIPRVKINEPIYSGASELNLRRGSATVDFKEPLDEKTTAIAGHVAGRYEYFTEIKSLVKGDVITVFDYKNKKSYKYVVASSYTVNPSNRSVLNDSKNKNKRKLVLITCHNYDSSRKVFLERWIVEAFQV